MFHVPAEIRSDHFKITVNGKPAQLAHAAANYYYLNFDISGRAVISITAPTKDYWAKGVEVQPWRLGIRPSLKGRKIEFMLDHPGQISITRPGDRMAGAEMLFIFANPPETSVPDRQAPGVRFYGPGVYHENIDAKSSDRIYLAGGALVIGSLNIWDVKNVKVYGRGTILYDGPQNPNADEGWIHRRNWHAIVMDHANNIEISGITCVVRSRAWMVQMKDSRHIAFENVKIIGGSSGNANQDGMDWLGGGDTSVRDSFIRSADDIFAMYGNWDGYSEAALTAPGHDVANITIENSVLSTSISNVVRVGWPKKIFNSSNFIMRNSDVLHMGMGACGIPFALFEIWADPAGAGLHSNYLFENVRLEDWYSLAQLTQPNPAIENVRFKDIWAIEDPSMVPSELSGVVRSVSLQQVDLAGSRVGNNADLPIEVNRGAENPSYIAGNHGLQASFTYSPGAIAPGTRVMFDASSSMAVRDSQIEKYSWSFGDGTVAEGRVVRHAFPDAEGTLWDHSGRFRVLLTVTDSSGHSASTYQPLVVTKLLRPATLAAVPFHGLIFKYFEGIPRNLSDMKAQPASSQGTAKEIGALAAKRLETYSVLYQGYLEVPRDGGYTFLMKSTDPSRVDIDSMPVTVSPPAAAQVCGSPGNAVQPSSGSIGLKAGKHSIQIWTTHISGENRFALLWQGPGIPLSNIPAQYLFHQ